MADKEPMQAAGSDPDGNRAKPATAGESGGGHYPNPHDDQAEHPSADFMGHGGQSDIAYSGTGAKGDPDAHNDNAATGSG